MSNEQLAAAMAANCDEQGNDLALAADVAAMTPEQRVQSEANARAFAAELSATLRPVRRGRDDSDV